RRIQRNRVLVENRLVVVRPGGLGVRGADRIERQRAVEGRADAEDVVQDRGGIQELARHGGSKKMPARGGLVVISGCLGDGSRYETVACGGRQRPAGVLCILPAVATRQPVWAGC